MEELLQLNDDATVQYRLSTLTTVRLFSAEIDNLEQQLKEVDDLLRKGKISQTQHAAEILVINQDLATARYSLQSHTGELPLPPLRKQRQGLTLLPP